MAEEESPRGRPKRVSASKQKKFDLLEKLKSGKKNKYDVGELENVYDEVDEKEYTKKVLQRQDDDWIVDDGGGGYVEDGREIFDDDLDEESIEKSRRTVVTGRKRSRASGDLNKGNIKNLIAGMPSKKKKEAPVKLDEDDILGDILGEIGSSQLTSSGKKVTFASPRDSAAKAYLSNFNAPPPRKYTPRQLISSDRGPLASLPNFQTPVVNLNGNSKEPDPLDMEVTPIEVKAEPQSELDSIDDFGDSFNDAFDEEIVPQVEKAEPKVETLIKEEMVSPKQPLPPPQEDFPSEFDMVPENEVSAPVVVDKSNLPMITTEDGQEVLRFYYLDAHEEAFSNNGTVYFFGKIWVESAKTHVSCCVTVKNIERLIYLLPREKRVNLQTGETTNFDVTMSDVYHEFNHDFATKYKVLKFKSRKTTMKYAFGKSDVPLESEYLEVRYSPEYPALPSDLSGETFSMVFGTRTSFLELFLLERKIKGPSWLDVATVEKVPAPVSWCKVEALCSNPKSVTVNSAGLKPPPLVLSVVVPQALFNAKTKQSEIVSVSCLVNTAYPIDKPPPERLFNQHFSVLSRPSDIPWPYDLKPSLQAFTKTQIQKMDSERTLLNCFLTKFFLLDVDVIVCHDLLGYTIELLLSRLAHHKIPNWSRFGRLRRSTVPAMKKQMERIAFTGRLLCDVKVSAKELIRSRSYDLDALCYNVLHFPEGKRVEMTQSDFKDAYSSGSSIVNAIWHNMCDATYILRIFAELNVLPLALQITSIAGNVLSRTLMGGRSERNEFLLLHAFYSKGYILPDKEYKKKQDEQEKKPAKGRKKPSYAGGLVLDPVVGFYDQMILLMDFNSLYPSIIQEYNICFTTIPINQVPMEDDFLDDYNKYFPTDSAEKGVLPTEIRKLVESRRGVKDLLKAPNLAPDLRQQYDIRQMALKLTANSMYGCLGFSYSRFYAKPLAALVTAKGREILLNTKKIVESFGYNVIYGDTDSIMINTAEKDYDKVFSVGRKLKTEINKCYKQVELDIDGVFKYMLLLKKKKYAAVAVTKSHNGELIEKREVKGLDMVRRDWCQLSAEAGKYVLDQILSDMSSDDRIENVQRKLETIRQDLESELVPLTLLTVTKELAKAPEEYADKNPFPHVQVALRLNSGSSKRLKRGDTVSYVICTDGTNNPPTQRAYHVNELKKNPILKIDVNYYLAQQIHPVVSRMCDPIEGLDAATIARCLGLDPTRYNKQIEDCYGLQEHESIFGKDDEEKFKNCEKFSFTCQNEKCKMENTVDHPLRKLESGLNHFFLDKCVNPTCELTPKDYLPYLQNLLQIRIRHFVNKYAQNFLACDDPACDFRTNLIRLSYEGDRPICSKCKNGVLRTEYTGAQLFLQLSFFARIFDPSCVKTRVKLDPETEVAYQVVHSKVTQVLDRNKHSMIHLGNLFAKLSLPKKTLDLSLPPSSF